LAALHSGTGLIAWQGSNGTTTLVQGKRVDLTTGTVDTTPFPLASWASPAQVHNVALAGGPNGFLLTSLATPDPALGNSSYAAGAVQISTSGAVTPAGASAIPGASYVGPFMSAKAARKPDWEGNRAACMHRWTIDLADATVPA